ncbi:MAG: hypothetical protein AB1540_13390 [Bdellovibrionota bacterium]
MNPAILKKNSVAVVISCQSPEPNPLLFRPNETQSATSSTEGGMASEFTKTAYGFRIKPVYETCYPTSGLVGVNPLNLKCLLRFPGQPTEQRRYTRDTIVDYINQQLYPLAHCRSQSGFVKEILTMLREVSVLVAVGVLGLVNAASAKLVAGPCKEITGKISAAVATERKELEPFAEAAAAITVEFLRQFEQDPGLQGRLALQLLGQWHHKADAEAALLSFLKKSYDTVFTPESSYLSLIERTAPQPSAPTVSKELAEAYDRPEGTLEGSVALSVVPQSGPIPHRVDYGLVGRAQSLTEIQGHRVPWHALEEGVTYGLFDINKESESPVGRLSEYKKQYGLVSRRWVHLYRKDSKTNVTGQRDVDAINRFPVVYLEVSDQSYHITACAVEAQIEGGIASLGFWDDYAVLGWHEFLKIKKRACTTIDLVDENQTEIVQLVKANKQIAIKNLVERMILGRLDEIYNGTHGNNLADLSGRISPFKLELKRRSPRCHDQMYGREQNFLEAVFDPRYWGEALELLEK